MIEKFFRFLDLWYTRGMLLALGFCLFIGGYCIYDAVRLRQEVQESSGAEHQRVKQEKPIVGNMVCWLSVPGTNIDYPVMQGKDNTEYLNTNPYGEYSLSGSLFLDSRNHSDFSDDYSLIYGHHMEQKLMFGALDDYLDDDFLLDHEYGSIRIQDQEEQEFQIFASMEVLATENRIFAPTEVTYQDTLDYVVDQARILDADAIPKRGERLIALSTCKYPDTAMRTVVVGYFLPEE